MDASLWAMVNLYIFYMPKARESITIWIKRAGNYSFFPRHYLITHTSSIDKNNEKA